MLELLFNHLVLPPRLPGEQDRQIDDVELGLMERTLLASRKVRDIVAIDFRDGWESIQRSLQACKVVNIRGKLDRTSLLNELSGLQREVVLILHIAQQNAGLLIRRHHE